ncbi:hypothetical protein AMAG_18559 [Allomyces macrogynus ATCC 38327]|uniref:Uncharacterized protein n=1 Tax=Allomyces macrogynus (strain ATCC 38327) TaxID=578462 RepID=A0A0L0SDU2_ALLM3|nr:hypothetical protein AMAG_18559 [Allomyces macrogynus ATCC 38327]|eukprot:KNE60555.1 hypothetical protein AMAG_18559 [Allomyces macrogynus ATCC 38327]
MPRLKIVLLTSIMILPSFLADLALAPCLAKLYMPECMFDHAVEGSHLARYTFPVLKNLDMHSMLLPEHLAAVADMPVLTNAEIQTNESFSKLDFLWP